MFQCSICSLKHRTFSLLCAHLGYSHSRLNRFPCGIDGCRQSFKNANSFKTHGYAQHREVVQYLQTANTSHASASLGANSSTHEEDSIGVVSNLPSTSNSYEIPVAEISIPVDHGNCDNLESRHHSLENSVADVFVKVREIDLVPSSVARNIFTSFSCLMDVFHTEYKDVFEKSLKDNNIQIEHMSHSLREILDSSEISQRLFKKTTSDFLINKHIENSMPYISPYAKRLGIVNGKPLFGHYVSIRSVVGNMMQCDDYLAETLSYLAHDSDAKYFGDFKDSFSAVPKPAKNMEGNLIVTIPLMLYSDEFEVCNPIGSSKKKHKLCAFYYSLLSVHPMYRSEVKSIQLACLIKDSFRKAVGLSKVAQPLIDELKSLAREPIVIGSIHFFVKLVMISADNLTANGLAGFQQNFSSGKFCRHCMIAYPNHKTAFTLDHNLARSLETYNINSEALSNGVLSRCCLLDLDDSFDPTSLFPCDIMHDFLEGIIPITVAVVLHNLIHAKSISLATINDSLKQFIYSKYDNRNPYSCEISSKNLRERRLPGTASQKWSLLVFLPFILGDHIDRLDNNWSLLLQCRDLADMLLCDALPKDKIAFLKCKITWFLQSLSSLSPQSITPKCHFLLHYPAIIERFGPPKRYWTMRFESLHQYFKDVTKRLRNFKNISKTLSTRFQYRQACFLNEQKLLQNFSDVIGGPGKNVAIFEFPTDLRGLLKETCELPYFDEGESVFEVSWAEFAGIRYSNDRCMVVIDLLHDDEAVPLFMDVCHIIFVRSKCYLMGYEVHAVRFDEHVHAYVCEKSNRWAISCLKSLSDHRAFGVYDKEGVQHVIMKYNTY